MLGIRPLGQEGAVVSTLGLDLSGISSHASDDETFYVLNHALALGYSFWLFGDDNHHRERKLQRYFESRPLARDWVFLAAQVDARLGGHHIRLPGHNTLEDSVIARLDAPRTRLALPRISILFISGLSAKTAPVAMSAAQKLIEGNKLKYIALDAPSEEVLRIAHAVHPVTAVRTDENSALRVVCRELGVSVVVSQGGHGHGSHFATAIAKHDMNSALDTIAKSHLATIGQVGLAWMLAQQDDVLPIVRAGNGHELESGLRATRLGLEDQEIKLLERTTTFVQSLEHMREESRHGGKLQRAQSSSTHPHTLQRHPSDPLDHTRSTASDPTPRRASPPRSQSTAAAPSGNHHLSRSNTESSHSSGESFVTAASLPDVDEPPEHDEDEHEHVKHAAVVRAADLHEHHHMRGWDVLRAAKEFLHLHAQVHAKSAATVEVGPVAL